MLVSMFSASKHVFDQENQPKRFVLERSDLVWLEREKVGRRRKGGRKGVVVGWKLGGGREGWNGEGDSKSGIWYRRIFSLKCANGTIRPSKSEVFQDCFLQTSWMHLCHF